MHNDKAIVLMNAVRKAPKGLIVEIGCIRQDKEVPEDGYSTVYLARFCQLNKNWRFLSFDNSKDASTMANRVLSEQGLSWFKVECKDGVEALKKVGPISFLYLDSHKDPFFSFEQYKAAELIPGAIVAIDDTHQIDDYEFGKATLLIQVFESRGIEFDIVPTFENENYKTGMTIAVLPAGKLAGVA